MESLLGRVVVMVVVGVVGGAVAILLVRAESKQRQADEDAGTGGEDPPAGGAASAQVFQTYLEEVIHRNQSFNQNDASANDMLDEAVRGTSSIGDFSRRRLKAPREASQSDNSILMTSQLANGMRTDGDFLDELFLTLKRKLLSYPSEKMLSGERRKTKFNPPKKASKRRKREVDDVSDDDTWREILEKEILHHPISDEKSEISEFWEKNTNGHRIRHSRKKAHHRQIEDVSPDSYDEKTENPVFYDSEQMGQGFSTQTQIYNPSPFTITGENRTDNRAQNVTQKRAKSLFDNFTNVSIMGNITHIRTPKDIMDDENNIANEIREALLLAVPLSLLMTVILLVCIAFCCCRYRTHPAYTDHLSYTLREDDEEYLHEWPLVSFGVCDVCLPDISYQAHLSQKIKNAKKRRSGDQIELVLEGGETVEGDDETGEDGLRYHPPLYALLSNLPPGSSHLEDDDEEEDDQRKPSFVDSSSFGSSLPRRSQSLEYLTV